jgi:hypothetical protein
MIPINPVVFMKVRRCICVKNKVDLNLKTTSYLGAFRLFIAEKHILRKIPIRIAIGIIPFGHEIALLSSFDNQISVRSASEI